MKVEQIWRYPVKSMGGEKLPRAVLGSLGIEGDRVVHVEDESGHVIASRTHHRLLGHHATLNKSDEPLVDDLLWSDPKSRAAVVNIVGPGAKLVQDESVDRFDVLPYWLRRMELSLPLDMMADDSDRIWSSVASRGWPSATGRGNVYISETSSLGYRISVDVAS